MSSWSDDDQSVMSKIADALHRAINIIIRFPLCFQVPRRAPQLGVVCVANKNICFEQVVRGVGLLLKLTVGFLLRI